MSDTSDTSDAGDAGDAGDANETDPGDAPEAPDPDQAVTGEGDNAGDEPEAPLPDTPVVADWANAGLEGEGPSGTVTADWTNAGLEGESPSGTVTADWSNIGLAHVGPMGGGGLASVTQAGVGLDTAQGEAVFFTVTLDVVDLGYWTKISGLGMSIAVTDRGDSAMTFFQHHLPGHLTYDKITLERPVSANSANIMNWFAAYHMLPVPTSAQISCVDQTGSVIMTWDMLGVSPVAWKGPSFDAASSNPAMEQLTIQHMGFM